MTVYLNDAFNILIDPSAEENLFYFYHELIALRVNVFVFQITVSIRLSGEINKNNWV